MTDSAVRPGVQRADGASGAALDPELLRREIRDRWPVCDGLSTLIHEFVGSPDRGRSRAIERHVRATHPTRADARVCDPLLRARYRSSPGF